MLVAGTLAAECYFLKPCKLRTWQVSQGNNSRRIAFNSFQSSDAFHIGISHLIYTVNQMIGFYMKFYTWLKWVNELTFTRDLILYLS